MTKRTAEMVIGITLMLGIASIVYAAKPKPSPLPSPPPQLTRQGQMEQLAGGATRFENNEVICYFNTSCYWKPLDEVDSESQDSDYARK